MPTYLQLEAEPVWGQQFTPPALANLAVRLRKRFGLGPNDIGSGGDNNHLTGRHRSRNWCLTSRFCTRRSYGTQDQRDLAGNGNWYRAIDIGITGQPLYDACRRVDTAVRAGRLPGLAEWFGTFDGKTVVGWYEGHASTSDSSHLGHGHLGFWTGSADDAALMDLVYAIVTGEDEAMPLTKAEQADLALYVLQGSDSAGLPPKDLPAPVRDALADRNVAAQIKAALAQIQQPQVDVAALAAAIVANPDFRAALVEAAFQGAQRAEKE